MEAVGGFFGWDTAEGGSDAVVGEAGVEAADAEAPPFCGMCWAVRSDVNHQVPTKRIPKIKPIIMPLAGELGVDGAGVGLPEIRVESVDSSVVGRACVGSPCTWVAGEACSVAACTKSSEVLS